MATLHDAVLIEVFRGDTEQVDQAAALMELASKEVVGGIIRVDREPIRTNWKQEKKHQDLFDEIFKEIESYEVNLKAANDPTPLQLTTN